jgi:hypothetical protein
MRRTFTRRLGVSPTAYRSGFLKVLEAPGGDLYVGALDPAARTIEAARLN